MKLVLATRRSQLALAQSRGVKARLEALGVGVEVELREYVTRGDQVQHVPLSEVGGKGLFTREIEDALLAGEAELAVHSLKDLPAEMPTGLMLGAVPERETPLDALVLPGCDAHLSSVGRELSIIPLGATLGTGSLRRAAQIRHLRPDLRAAGIRGNVDTRLRKLDEGQYDAIVLAAAGLRRLGLQGRIAALLPVDLCTPAPAQGALGIQCRAEDAETRRLLARLDDPTARATTAAERALMEGLGGGCSVPLGAHATLGAGELRLTAALAAPDGVRLIRETLSGPESDPVGLGRRVAEALRMRGALDLLAISALPG